MEKQKKGFIQWVKTHKKELITTGVSIAAIVGIIVGIKNKDSIIVFWETLRKSIDKNPMKAPSNYCEIDEKIVKESLSAVENISMTEIVQVPAGRIIQSTFDVSNHIRNLPDGWHASAEKMATAAEHGYNLKPRQTWVDRYTKGVAVA